jgi:hypothetical protein
MLNKVDDGVLLVRPGTVVTQMMPYGQSGISLTLNYVRLTRRYQMLNEVDDGVLLVRLGNFVTQMMPYGQPGKEELTCQN